MQFIDYIKLSNQKVSDGQPVRIAIVTNFTDDICKRVLTGMCVAENILATIYAVPFGQYYLELKNSQSELYKLDADVTFILFDVNPYYESEFTADESHAEQVFADIGAYASAARGTVVVATIAQPPHTAHGNLFKENQLHKIISQFNSGIEALDLKNVHVLEMNRLMHLVGERRARDLRSMYAFRQPFTHEMTIEIAREWFAYVRALLGKARKCIVVDLDNTLWGGVVGEVGALGITLGPDYPGNAFQNFQRTLLEYFNRGIILAINSRNNLADVQEVFEKNKNMILKEKHFSIMQINWNDKAQNLRTIANELNIGLDSIVFLDDDAMNRDLVRTQLPQVHTPDFSLTPEHYAHTLLSLDVFHQLALTAEDAERGRMYAEERQRKVAQETAGSTEDYFAQLGIQIAVSVNAPEQTPRIAQLTQKTNQFNLTTRRYTESDIEVKMVSGIVIVGDVTDKFGGYGLTIESIVLPTDELHVAELDTFLMSCRVMGRKVEHAFFAELVRELKRRGFTKLRAHFIPTAKNMPTADFLPSVGFEKVGNHFEHSLEVVDSPAHIHIII